MRRYLQQFVASWFLGGLVVSCSLRDLSDLDQGEPSGAAGKGGTRSRGGSTARGGTQSNGGSAGRGGTQSNGGSAGRGGTQSNGGSAGRGGTGNIGGSIGGAAGKNGVAGASGSAGTCSVGATSLGCIPLKESVAYRLHPKHAATKCIDVPQATFAGGSAVIQNDCATSITQKFWLTTGKDGLMAIRSAWTGLCLHAAADTTQPGANVVQDACVDQASRRWSVVLRDGGFSIVQGQGGLVLDVAGSSSTANGAALQQSTYDGSADMIWTFEEVSGGMLALQPYEQAGTYLARTTRAIQPVAASSAEVRWKLLPGAADPNCVTFELSTTAGVYLRHQNYLMWADATDGGSTFTKDATFCFRDGLAATGADRRSLESLNYSGNFITLPNSEQAALEAQADTDAFRAKATWVISGN